MIIPIELMYLVMLLSNAFRKGTCKHESKTPMKAVREGSIILRYERPTSRKSAIFSNSDKYFCYKSSHHHT